MQKKAKNNQIWKFWLGCVVFSVSISLCFSVAFAYFTGNARAKGGYIIEIDGSSDVEEPEVASWVKHVVVTNTGNGEIAVRVKAFCGDSYVLRYVGEHWEEHQDGYCYYSLPLDPGAEAPELMVQIRGIERTGYDDGFTVTIPVVQESVPAVFLANGDLDIASSWAQRNAEMIERGNGNE